MEEPRYTIKGRKAKAEVASLNRKERKIYHSVRQTFAATSHDSAYDIALQGGVRWNFIQK